MDISYRHAERVPADSWFGRGARWLGRRPIAGGFLAGVVVVMIATARVPGVFVQSPGNAVVLSLLVIGVWTLLFFFMRSFFERQGYTERQTTRRLILEDDRFRWEEDGELLLEVEAQRIELLRPVGTEEREMRAEDDPHPIWIVVDGDKVAGDAETPLRIETRITAGEAKAYDVAESGEADEVLSVGEVQSLLGEVERKVAPQRH